MVASIQEEVRASIRGEGDDDDDGPVRKIVENRCGEDEKEEKKFEYQLRLRDARSRVSGPR